MDPAVIWVPGTTEVVPLDQYEYQYKLTYKILQASNNSSDVSRIFCDLVRTFDSVDHD
jgi:hypothetical protein